MLSIGKLAVGQADYYLEQARGAVTRAGAVSPGVEDYYLSGPEAAGVWVGDGPRALGLDGTVDALRLERVLSGCAPASGEPLGRVVPRRVPGFDLTFSAPQSVSVLFGIGDGSVRGVIQDAHDQAVREALAYVEREAGFTRRGAGGSRVIRGNGLTAAVPVDMTGDVRVVHATRRPQHAKLPHISGHSWDTAAKRETTPETTKPRRSAVSRVPPPGIEPGTFGLRVRCSAS